MAVPKRRKSKSKRDMRRSQWKLSAINVITCPNCMEPMLPHHICPSCGYYKGRQIIEKEEE